MADETRYIGLSLGADICWPICFEEIMKRLKLNLPIDDKQLSFEVERLTIEPFNLQGSCKYSIVLDRLTHWYHTSREWIKKAVLMDDLYVLNNPWAVQSMEKQTSYCAMMRLGLPIPETWMIPPKSYERSDDLDHTLKNYAKLFDLAEIGEELGYPLFMKPYDGGGWRGVSKIDDAKALKSSYDDSGKFLMHLQKAVNPYDSFVRCIGLGPQVAFVDYDPGAPLHARYQPGVARISEADKRRLRAYTLIINSFFCWDFNSCESLRREEEWYPIDFANPCPDSQVTSLNWHFPWIVKANIRWAVYVAATGRKMRMNQNWSAFYEIADSERNFDEKLDAYTKLAEEHFELDRFEEFCNTHLSHLDEVASGFFGSDTAHDAVRQKVIALFPTHEVEQFTAYFWKRIQEWRNWDLEQR